MRPFKERVVGRPSRCTLPFLGTVRSFCHVPENVDFRLPLEGERDDEPPEGFFTLYEEHLMRASPMVSHSVGYSRVSEPFGSFDNTQPHSSFSRRFVHRPRPSPWWSAVLGSFLSRESPCGGRGSSISFQLIN
ncbi:unnamed protein product [Brassica rapa]|uniref:Uncharacterized protein n=1 Tax=Brassica campestris TaxID=3711 RepID=A0A8D9D6V7_BRACM|nr:unnamed protein product [Brassica rapa]